MLGVTYVFTVKLRDRCSDLLVVEIAGRGAGGTGAACISYQCLVRLRDHMHCQGTLPEAGTDFPSRPGKIKAGLTGWIARRAEPTIGTLRQRESGIWQRRFAEHTIRDERDYPAHMDEFHCNPLDHRLIVDARAWEISSFGSVWRPHCIRRNGAVPGAM